MTQLTIEVPDRIVDFLNQQVSEGKGDTVSDVVSQLLWLHCDREDIERKVMEAIHEDAATDVTPEFWDSLRELAVNNAPSK